MEKISRSVLCMKTLANNCLKPFQLKKHLNNAQKEQDSKCSSGVAATCDALSITSLVARKLLGAPFSLVRKCAGKPLLHKSVEDLKSKEGCFKCASLDAEGASHQTNFSIVEASYVVELRIAKAKCPHTIAETLVKPYLHDCAKTVLDDRACNKLKQVPLFKDTVKSRIIETSSDIKFQLTLAVTCSALPFAIWLAVVIKVTARNKLELDDLRCTLSTIT